MKKILLNPNIWLLLMWVFYIAVISTEGDARDFSIMAWTFSFGSLVWTFVIELRKNNKENG